MKDSEKELIVKLSSAINEVLRDSDNDNHIDLSETDATDFFYVLGAIVPCLVYSELTNNEINLLDFNHLINSLIVQKGFKIDLVD